jgi:uncharacterized protein YyaL (SSP411 family)
MIKTFFAIAALLLTASYLFAQEEGIQIYDPDADAKANITTAVERAQAENKHVLVQIGGNWCPWCIKLHGFMAADPQIDSLLTADYYRVMVNYSKENKNDAVMKELEYPQRFGFPVLVILDGEGSRLHTQDSWFLEKDKTYDREKVLHFLKSWNYTAVNP